MVGEDQAKATIRNLFGRHVQKESMHSDVWSVVMWPSRAAFCKFGRQMISGNCGKWLCRACQIECKAFNVLRDIFRTYWGIWARGCRGKPSRCVCCRPAGPICCADQHLDVSVGYRRAPSLAVFTSTFFFVSRQLIVCFQVQADIPLRPHLPFSLPFPSSIPGV